MVKSKRRKRRRSACTKKEEGTVDGDSPDLSRTALSKKAMRVPSAASTACSTSCSTVTKVEGGDVTSIADSPPLPRHLPGAAVGGETGGRAAGPQSPSVAFPHGDVHCNDSVCDGAMIEELLGGLCAEDVLGSFSVTMSSEPPHALCAPDHPGCDVAVDQPPPLLLSAPPPLSSTPVARPQSTALTRGKVQSVGPVPTALSSTTDNNAGLVEESAAAVLLQACPGWGNMESVVHEETGGKQAEDSCCYPSGTFYGLSAEVKRLLRDTRGITALYGRLVISVLWRTGDVFAVGGKYFSFQFCQYIQF